MSTKPRLSGKTALITGAQQGIGAAIVRTFAGEGANIVINWLHDHTAAGALVAELSDGKIRLVQGGVSNPKDIEHMMKAADDLGGIVILVNNAAVFPRVKILEITANDWDGLMAINLRAAFLASQAACKRMVEAGRQCAIVNL